MLERARPAPPGSPPTTASRLDWVQGDMSRLDLPGRRFGLIFVAYNSFWLLDSEPAQEACLPPCPAPGPGRPAGARPLPAQRRRPAGRHRARPGAAHVPPRAHPAAGQGLHLRRRGTSPPRTCATSRRRPRDGPADLIARFRYRLRLASPEAVQALLERAGYAVEETSGDYRREPLLPDSARAIFVCPRRHPGSA